MSPASRIQKSVLRSGTSAEQEQEIVRRAGVAPVCPFSPHLSYHE